MSENERDGDSGAEIGHRRRESDRTGRAAGIRAGGRRRTDRQPQSKWATIAIIGSFTFSGGLMLWAFTLPFRGGSRGVQLDEGVTATSLEREARLTPDEYLDYARDLDRRVLDQFEDKAEGWKSKSAAPSDFERKEQWASRIEQREGQLTAMQKELEGEPFLKGTVEWEYRERLEAIRQDSPR